jgi:hypothetical protein
MIALAVAAEILAVFAAVIGFSYVSRRLDPGREPGAAGTAPAPPQRATPLPGGRGYSAPPAEVSEDRNGYDNGVTIGEPDP